MVNKKIRLGIVDQNLCSTMEISSQPSPPTSPLRPCSCSSPAACSISSQSSLSSSSGCCWQNRLPEVEHGCRSYYESSSGLCWSRRRWHGKFYLLTILLFLSGMMMMVGGSQDFSLQCPSGCKCTWVSGKKTADCRNSHWSTIPSGLSPEVQVLEMSDTTIKSLPKDAFRSVGLVNLQKVFLQNCKIERIDRDAFRELEIMIELDLSGNLVSTLNMETFESNIRLRELKLSKNPLTKLTGRSFPPLNFLKLLDLSDCQLSTLPKQTFENLKQLETLNLAGNQFTYISEELLAPMTKLKSLSLSGNPWKCDCRLKSLRDWVISRNLFQHLTKCAEPPHLNFPWDQLMSADFACRPEIVSVQINGKPTDAFLVHTDIGSDITLECLVRGNPPPDLKWVRDGQVLTNTSRSFGKSYFLHIGEEPLDGDLGISHDLRGQWVNLTILKTDPVDAGEYTCVGSNAGGVVEKNLTLNFQDVPSGAGLGHGLGGLGGGARESGWIWILIAAIAIMVVTSILVTLVCLCSRKRRIKTTRAQDVKGSDDQPQQRQLLLTPTSRSESSEKNADDGTTTMLLLQEKYLVGPDARSKSSELIAYSSVDHRGSPIQRPGSAQPLQPPPPSSSLTIGPHGGVHSSTEYPDLLDLPHNTRFQESPAPSTVSTLQDSTRMLITPHQLNPATLSSRLGAFHPSQIYSSGGRPASPYTPSPFSPSEPAFLPPGARPGYVTLPRRPRVPSWSPGTTGFPDSPSRECPSPTGSAATISIPFIKPVIKYDNLGPRTTADGSSRLSLNNIPDNGGPSHGHHFQNNVPLVTGTLGRHSMLRSTPTAGGLGQSIKHFAPIQEVEPGESEGSPSEKSRKLQEQSNIKKTDTNKPSSNISNTLPKGKKVPPKPPPKPPKKSPESVKDPAPISNGGVDLKKSPPKNSDSPVGGVNLGDDGTEV